MEHKTPIRTLVFMSFSELVCTNFRTRLHSSSRPPPTFALVPYGQPLTGTATESRAQLPAQSTLGATSTRLDADQYGGITSPSRVARSTIARAAGIA